jgi:hypothetical protein
MSQTIIVPNVDVDTLRDQRDYLVELCSTAQDLTTRDGRDHLDGVINLLDTMLDTAEGFTDITFSHMTWEKWSREVIDQLIDLLEVPNGDAQAIFESQALMTVLIWHDDYTPEQAAKAIDLASSTPVPLE